MRDSATTIKQRAKKYLGGEVDLESKDADIGRVVASSDHVVIVFVCGQWGGKSDD